MALNAGIHWGVILRVDVEQTIKQEAWKWLLSEARFGFNFDGEIYGLGIRDEARLRESGFRGDEAGLQADFVDVHHGYRTAVTAVDWLERVEVAPLVDGIEPFQAWKHRNSGVYTVVTNKDRLVMKGTEVDWPPLVGRIY